MEESVKKFCKSMGGFCSHLHSSCDALKQSVDRRPIPLDSASSTFIQSLNRHVSNVSTQLNLLEVMSFGTVSFEELIGYCNEVYKKIQNDILEVQDPLRRFGYDPDVKNQLLLLIENDEDDSEVPGLSTPLCKDSKPLEPTSPYSQSIIKCLEEDPLHDGSLRFKNLGLSDVCLATLSSEAHDEDNKTNIYLEESTTSNLEDIKDAAQPAEKTMLVEDEYAEPDAGIATDPSITISMGDYESLPSYMKSLASLEDLLGAVEKMNSRLEEKKRTKQSCYFPQEEVHSLGLGPKGRAYVLLLMRMNHLTVETRDGVISYRVL